MGEIDGSFRAWGLPKGGTGAIAQAIASSARALGVEIRTEAAVAHLLMEKGRAAGVVLANGDEIRAKTVISGLDPHRTFLHLVPRSISTRDRPADPALQDARLLGQVNLALDALPELTCLPEYGPTCRAASPSRRRSTTWSALTTTPSTALSPAGRSWTFSSRR